MNKKEFLAMSLPHGLKIIIIDEYEVVRIHELDHYLYQYICDSQKDETLYKSKLILHPLTDLTEPIEHKGKKFVPIEKLREMNDGGNIYIQDDYIGIDNGYACAYYISDALKFVSVLIEWHFDIAGLIEKGEAIDVNTLPENPYE